MPHMKGICDAGEQYVVPKTLGFLVLRKLLPPLPKSQEECSIGGGVLLDVWNKQPLTREWGSIACRD